MSNIPSRIMLDANAHNLLKQNESLLRRIAEIDTKLHLSAYQANEIRDGLDECSEELRSQIEQQIELVKDLADPIVTGVNTSGHGELYGYNYGGSTGKIYKELIAPDPNIRNVDRPDAIGAEAAIIRDMVFVTDDRGLQEKMIQEGYEEYLLTLDEFENALR